MILDLTPTLQAALTCAISLQNLDSIKITGFSVFHWFFKKIPVDLILDSTPTLQAVLMGAISLQYLNSIKITGFSRFYRFFKYRKIWLRIRNLRQKLHKPWNFYRNRTIFRFSPLTWPDPFNIRSGIFENLILVRVFFLKNRSQYQIQKTSYAKNKYFPIKTSKKGVIFS